MLQQVNSSLSFRIMQTKNTVKFYPNMKEIIFNTKYNNKYLYLDGNIVFLHNNFFNSIDGSTDKLDNYYTRKFIFLKEKLSKESKNITYTTNITPQIIKENIANLKQLLIEVTDGCNLACEYCGYGKLYGNYDKRNGKMQSFQQVRILLDFLINEWNSQYNNSYKNNIYMLDCNTNTQYKIDDTLEKVSVVSKDNKIKYFDGARLKDKKVDSINNTKIKFYKNETNFDIKNKYKTDDIRKSNDNYYFKSGDNIYLVFKDDYSNPLLLFSLAGLKDWTVSADSVFGIVGDTMYAYNSEFGLKDIIKYNEFNYHQKNMYGVSKNN